jgi:hypothetical protein
MQPSGLIMRMSHLREQNSYGDKRQEYQHEFQLIFHGTIPITSCPNSPTNAAQKPYRVMAGIVLKNVP